MKPSETYKVEASIPVIEVEEKKLPEKYSQKPLLLMLLVALIIVCTLLYGVWYYATLVIK
jgi:hypothetical protein